MAVHTHQFVVETRGECDMHDLTHEVSEALRANGLRNGLATVFVRHTTAAIIIGEFEPGLVHDMPEQIERMAPALATYRHNALNHDDNAHSHLVGSIMGPSETTPFVDGSLVLGTWQQIILLELDTHPRRREIVVQLIGE
jgi:secondary thiamine-phosphate synthase enzyme